jgi:cell division protein FtsN
MTSRRPRSQYPSDGRAGTDMTLRNDRRSASAATAKRRAEPKRKSGFGGTLLGIFIGVAVGLALAAGVALYLTKAGNPYQSAAPGRDGAREAAKEPARPGRPETAAAEKPRFDFYKILPGVEEPKIPPKAAERVPPDKATVERATAPEKGEGRTIAKADERAAAPSPEKQPKVGERYWLQAGSFASPADAENLKARLAFAGWEATIQPVTLPDKGQRYRVRLGPYDNTDQLTRMKGELAARGFDAAVIK